ncbi:MAG: hypothetical protein RLP16_03955, partial [Alphaproteobacteria bacterium]
MGSRRFGRVNWMGLYTLCTREIQRFMSVWTQTVLAPLVTAGLFMMIFSIAIGPRRGEVMGVDFSKADSQPSFEPVCPLTVKAPIFIIR